MPGRAQNRLEKLTTKHKPYVLFGFDIEYRRADGLLIEGCIGNEDMQDFYDSWESILDALFKLAKRHGKHTRFIVHAGDIAEYCHLIEYIMNNAREEYNVFPTFSGDNIVSLDIRKCKQRVQIYDMFALFPMGLEKISKIFAPDYPKLQGTVDFSKRDYDPSTDREYLRRDVQATVNSYRNISSMIMKHFGVQPSMTAAGTAMRAWLASLPDDACYFRLNSTVEDFCRGGYFGAYVYPGVDNLLHKDVVSYDITAAYGDKMQKRKYPIGNPLYSTEYQPDYMGMWAIEVTCIDARLPIVPYRVKDGVHWLGTPGARCKTVSTTVEIEYFKTHGYTVEVEYGVYWLESAYIFKDFIDIVESVEGIDSITKQCAKLIRNALYGRFGTKKFHEKVVITDAPTEEMMMYSNPQTGELIEHLYTVQEELNVAYIQPHWAGYITAYQRLAMFDLIFQCGVENCFGVDTDSIKTYATIVDEKQLPLSETEYGKGKIEAYFLEYRSHGPKNYVGIEASIGAFMKSKGIPKKAITREHIMQHLYRDGSTNPITIPFESITKSLAMMKSDGKKKFTSKNKRTLSSLNSDKWKIIDKRFYPLDVMAVV